MKSRYGLQIPLPQLSVASAAVFDVYMREGRADIRLCFRPQAIAVRHGHVDIFPECSKVLALVPSSARGQLADPDGVVLRTLAQRVELDTDVFNGCSNEDLAVASPPRGERGVGNDGSLRLRRASVAVPPSSAPGHRRLQRMFERKPSSRCPPRGNGVAVIMDHCDYVERLWLCQQAQLLNHWRSMRVKLVFCLIRRASRLTYNRTQRNGSDSKKATAVSAALRFVGR